MGTRRTRKDALDEKRDLVMVVYNTRSVVSLTVHPVLFGRLLTEIMLPQSQWTDRIDVIRAFHVIRGDKRRAYALSLRVQLRTKRWVTVSWRSSILLEFPTTKLQACPIRSAMRQCVRRQICSFRRSHQTRCCALCDTTDSSVVYHVDHQEPTFAALVSNFLGERQNVAGCPDPSAMQYGRNGRRRFPTNCHAFARRWRNFHRKHAVLRILCRDCNLRRPRD